MENRFGLNIEMVRHITFNREEVPIGLRFGLITDKNTMKDKDFKWIVTEVDPQRLYCERVDCIFKIHEEYNTIGCSPC